MHLSGFINNDQYKQYVQLRKEAQAKMAAEKDESLRTKAREADREARKLEEESRRSGKQMPKKKVNQLAALKKRALVAAVGLQHGGKCISNWEMDCARYENALKEIVGERNEHLQLLLEG